MTRRWQHGDQVQVKGTGQPMRVEYYDSFRVICSWQDERGQKQLRRFAEDSLEPWSPPAGSLSPPSGTNRP